MSHENHTASVRYYILPDWPAYRVGDDSSFWTRHKLGKKGPEDQFSEEWRPRVPYLAEHGYFVVSISRGGKKDTLYIHRLLLEAFVGPCPPGLEGCHKDDNKLNNSLDNLYWGTRKENVADMIRNGNQANGATYGFEYPRGENHPGVKLSDDAVREIRIACENGDRKDDIAMRYSVCASYVRGIWNGTVRPECGGPMNPKGSRGISKIEYERLARIRRKTQRSQGAHT